MKDVPKYEALAHVWLPLTEFLTSKNSSMQSALDSDLKLCCIRPQGGKEGQGLIAALRPHRYYFSVFNAFQFEVQRAAAHPVLLFQLWGKALIFPRAGLREPLSPKLQLDLTPRSMAVWVEVVPTGTIQRAAR